MILNQKQDSHTQRLSLGLKTPSSLKNLHAIHFASNDPL